MHPILVFYFGKTPSEQWFCLSTTFTSLNPLPVACLVLSCLLKIDLQVSVGLGGCQVDGIKLGVDVDQPPLLIHYGQGWDVFLHQQGHSFNDCCTLSCNLRISSWSMSFSAVSLHTWISSNVPTSASLIDALKLWKLSRLGTWWKRNLSRGFWLRM